MSWSAGLTSPRCFPLLPQGHVELSFTRCGSKGTALQPPRATWGGSVTRERQSHQGQSFINSPFLSNPGDELKCSTPRARRTGSTTRWRGVCTGSAGTPWPADGLVGDLSIPHGLLRDPPGPLLGWLWDTGSCWCCWRCFPFQWSAWSVLDWNRRDRDGFCRDGFCRGRNLS